MYIKQYSI